MRITDIRERTVRLASATRNADIAFSDMTASAVAVLTDGGAGGAPLVGVAFDSIGRYGHGGLIRERFAPRLLAADPDDYADGDTGLIDPARAFAIMMSNEKAGGHGERAGAVGLLDCALWDLRAKAEDKPLWAVLAERQSGGAAPAPVPVYASGGHYSSGGVAGLEDEIARRQDAGYERVKIKVGGAPLEEDRARIEAALRAIGETGQLAVDANGVWDASKALDYMKALAPHDLAWVEEPVAALDFEGLKQVAANSPLPLGTGENLFSADEVDLLLLHGGLRGESDWLQMDISFSYGITGYLQIIEIVERHGWSRKRLAPHAGHVLALQTTVGLGLGAHETAPFSDLPIAGLAEDATLENGMVMPGDRPGAGIEAMPRLLREVEPLLA